MAKIHSISIANFRGIKSFEQVFYKKKIVCIIGRGDSGKSTILEAISYVLSSSWNITFYDSDFYNCNTAEPIIIETTLYDIPVYFLQGKFGFEIRGINSKGEIFDDFEIEEGDKAITIQLVVKNDLEPVWNVINGRNEPVVISAAARARLNTFLISDFTDRHFSWSKGNPLYSLFKINEKEGEEEKNIVINALREAKKNIDNNSFLDFKKVVNDVVEKAKQFGIDISGTETTIDFKDISIKDNRVCLHDNNIPFRLKGKGAKRLISISIQAALADKNGIILIDEVEQGLEPDRVQHLVSILKKMDIGQIFITTHSRDAVVELDAKDIFLLHKDGNSLINADVSMQGAIRKNPEGLFAKKVIVCEGLTEIGICRALNDYLIEKKGVNAAYNAVRFVDGTGSSFIDYCKAFSMLGIKTCAFCDSDDKDINPKKKALKEIGIQIYDCDDNLSIEQQVFQDLPWKGVIKLVEYHESKSTENSVFDSIKARISIDENWKEKENKELREVLGVIAGVKKKEWFKKIDHGEYIGSVICEFRKEIKETKLYSNCASIIDWITNE